jgi:hypothetical protein
VGVPQGDERGSGSGCQRCDSEPAACGGDALGARGGGLQNAAALGAEKCFVLAQMQHQAAVAERAVVAVGADGETRRHRVPA